VRFLRVNQISCRMRAIDNLIYSFTSMSRSSVSRRERSKMKTNATNQAATTENRTVEAPSQLTTLDPFVEANSGGTAKMRIIGNPNETMNTAARPAGSTR
jgi:hypothetical protein